MEEIEGGLSEVEKRALRDLGEKVGGSIVVIVDENVALTTI